MGKKISSQTPKTIFSLQSPQNFYYFCNNSSRRSYHKLSAHSDNIDLYPLFSLDSTRSTLYLACVTPAYSLLLLVVSFAYEDYRIKQTLIKEISESFFKRESNKGLVNTVVIRTHSRRRMPKGVSTRLC